MTEACGSRWLPLRDYGWQCSGRELIVVKMLSTFGVFTPIVLPSRAMEIIEPEGSWDLPTRPFAGGNHYHLMVPSRPSPHCHEHHEFILLEAENVAVPMMKKNLRPCDVLFEDGIIYPGVRR